MARWSTTGARLAAVALARTVLRARRRRDSTARPMKGTARAARRRAEDRALAAALASRSQAARRKSDDRRSDAQRSVAVARAGQRRGARSVHRRDLSDGAPDGLDRHRRARRRAATRSTCSAALFPCGSITGAPKIRAMEVIAEVEQRRARRLYRRDRPDRRGRRCAVQRRDPHAGDRARRRATRDARARLGHRRRFAAPARNGTNASPRARFVTARPAPLRPDRDDGVRSGRRASRCSNAISRG